jgi:hypothetical protein
MRESFPVPFASLPPEILRRGPLALHPVHSSTRVHTFTDWPQKLLDRLNRQGHGGGRGRHGGRELNWSRTRVVAENTFENMSRGGIPFHLLSTCCAYITPKQRSIPCCRRHGQGSQGWSCFYLLHGGVSGRWSFSSIFILVSKNKKRTKASQFRVPMQKEKPPKR